MALTRTLLNTHFKKAWTFTTGYKLRVVNPATSESGAGLLTVGNVLAVNTSAKYKNTTSDPSTYVVKLTVEHGVDQSRIYALDPTLYLMDGNDTHPELREVYKISRDMAPTETATKRWAKWIGMHSKCVCVWRLICLSTLSCSAVERHRGDRSGRTIKEDRGERGDFCQ
jgi:hypothetical protein